MGLLAQGDPGWHTRDGQVCSEVTVSEADLKPVWRAQPAKSPSSRRAVLASSSQPQDAQRPPRPTGRLRLATGAGMNGHGMQ